MKKKNFTMLELMTVIAIMSILLGITMKVFKPDRAAVAIKQVGGSINIWSAKALNDNTIYRLEFTKNLIEVYNLDGDLISTKKILSDLSFVNQGSSLTIEFNGFGGMVDLSGARIYAGDYLARVNGFTGHLSYYELKEDY